ncbi:MAG: TIGR04206 family protein, partial [Halobacteriaceae archaeon]
LGLATPWTIYIVPNGEPSFVFAWGLVNIAPLHIVTLPTYLLTLTNNPLTLPQRLLAWPISTGLYGLAIGNYLLQFFDLEDQRLTAGLLFLAAGNLLFFTLGTTVFPKVIGLPIGTVIVGFIGILLYWRPYQTQ